MGLDFKLVAVKPCVVSDNKGGRLRCVPGDVIPFVKQWEILVRNKQAERVYAVDERRTATPPIPAKLQDLDKDELRDLLAAQGVPPHSIEGSGSKGYVVKADLIAAIEALR
jgi:hypothetical protein